MRDIVTEGATPLAAQKRPAPSSNVASPRRGVNSVGRPPPRLSLLVRHNGPHCSSSRLESGRTWLPYVKVFGRTLR